MDFFIIDGSGLKYMQDECLPHGHSGKYIQMQNLALQKEYVVFASYETFGHHSQILKSFCDFKWIKTYHGKKKKSCGWLPNSKKWKVGGGHWKCDQANGILKIENGSMAYGPSVLDENFKASIKSLPWMEGCEVQFV